MEPGVIAVIGHGRSPEGRGWGCRIDACSLVVRLWNCEWQAPADYGTRYDWGLIETHRKVLQQFSTHNRRTPRKGWIASKLYCTRDVHAMLPFGTVVIDQEQWLQCEGREIKGCGTHGVWQLTRGGIAALWAIHQTRPGDTVVLVGFDIIKAGVAPTAAEAFSPEYQASGGFWGLQGFTPGATKEGNHDYPAERRLIELVAARRGGIKLAWADELWTG
jgi:hypothetical protein